MIEGLARRTGARQLKMRLPRKLYNSALCSVCVLSCCVLVTAEDSCRWASAGDSAAPASRFIDLTATIGPKTVAWDSDKGLGSKFRKITKSQEKGDPATMSQIQGYDVHSATHVDAPCHFVLEECQKGHGVEKLSLEALIGPALVIEIPAHSNITGKLLQSLQIPFKTQRLLFKTSNTARRLMHKTPFESSYTGMTADGAQWLMDQHPSVQLVGIDYTSIAIFEDLPGAHNVLLPKHVVIVEGLVMDELKAGLTDLICLNPKFQGFDGIPIRCVASSQ